MDAEAVEPEDASGAQFADVMYEPADAVDSPFRGLASPLPDDGVLRSINGPPGMGKTSIIRSIMEALSSSQTGDPGKRLSLITHENQRVQQLLAELDEDEHADVLPALRFAANGDTVRLGRHDLVITGPNNFVVVECKSFASPVRAALEDSDRGRRLPATLTADEQAGAHWRALPLYAQRPLTLQACCTMSVPTSVSNVVGPPVPEATIALEEEWACILLWICEMYPPRASIRTTTQSRRLVRDYREGLRRFLVGVQLFLRSMAVTLLAALSHQTQAPTFLLVMLATARRYGRRDDGDVHALPAPALQPIGQGAVCLAA